MAQKFKKLQNSNEDSTAFGKWFATAVYDQHFIETEELAEFIQTQATVKKSDIKAVLDELGGALKHFFELGQKVKLDGIGIFKVGFSSIGTTKKDDCGAQNITTRRVLFQPESERIVVGQTTKDGKVKQKYVIVKTLVKDVVFEETYDTSLQPETVRVVVGQTKNKQNKVVQKYVIAKTLVKDVVFEETYDTSLAPDSEQQGNG